MIELIPIGNRQSLEARRGTGKGRFGRGMRHVRMMTLSPLGRPELENQGAGIKIILGIEFVVET